MRDRALDPRHLEEVLLGLLHALGDRGRHLLGLAVAHAHRAVAVPDHDQRGEAEPPAALDHLGHPVDRHDALDEGGLLRPAVTAAPVVPVAAVATAGALATARARPAALGSRHQWSLPSNRSTSTYPV